MNFKKEKTSVLKNTEGLETITAKGKHIQKQGFVPMRRGLMYPVTSTGKAAAFGLQLFHLSSKKHHYVIRLVCCVLHRET
jgi:hypothetical protein